ncbi:DUF1307 domain-containing protein [Enterococcus termitis]|jgi:uncharacterized lipoprotein YehR (DUF1307 family)|uniref:DUF1307 domain-containing protein n=1 Tax=Enterococcus termitis TaxID=332950 RepID=A0A1E5GAU0_9ENTE|nr:DUF1307 domain-containing protein [Enterococcus termitis]OEG09836.1 hypothetical protein BCR25_10045 [Enterococcus termitis]OJG98341.1 hypothetical protein RV18_GL003242 [Enterococcus termitis]
MKKILGVISVLVTLVILGACGGKAETTTFTQSPMAGTEVSIIVEHKGDKITGASAKAVFDNEKLMIADEEAADQVAEAFKTSSKLEDAKVKYTDKETVITYDAPAGSVKSGSSYKEGEKELIKMGFEKK